MIIEKGYGIQEDAIEQLSHLECKTIKIITKKGLLYTFPFEFILNNFAKNYGHGLQRFIQIKEMEIVNE